ncbi:hypothetical protein CEXT_396731 [Caerostris extrusa]|uniref:Uncharacterized protein n=1 Tax=Caerostris extrusa TaxID=172846 RepID=A0AAV4W2A7_CAEEX|nr:hypothetical protein CEXT_396731 [Caerostris extrusa]
MDRRLKLQMSRMAQFGKYAAGLGKKRTKIILSKLFNKYQSPKFLDPRIVAFKRIPCGQMIPMRNSFRTRI